MGNQASNEYVYPCLESKDTYFAVLPKDLRNCLRDYLARSILPVHYTNRRSLPFFRDSSLYFSCLPRDILIYCLAPYLSYSAYPELWSEAVIQPKLVHTFECTNDQAYINSLDFLPDGDILFRHPPKGIFRLNARTSEITCLFQDPNYDYSYDYSISQDTLYLIPRNAYGGRLDKYYPLTGFSTIRNQEAFLHQLNETPLLNALSSFLWRNPINLGSHQIHFIDDLADIRPVNDSSSPSFKLLRSVDPQDASYLWSYSAGYIVILILICPPTGGYKSIVEFYQLME